MEQLLLARITKPLGLKGEVRAFCLTSFPKQRFKKGNVFTLTNPKTKQSQSLTLASYRLQGDVLILSFKEIQSVEEAETLRGYEVSMDKDEAPLPEGYYRFEDLKGLKAIDDEGKEIGQVIDVTAYAPTKNLKLKSCEGKVFYVPFIDVFVGDIDLEKKTVVIHVVEGML